MKRSAVVCHSLALGLTAPPAMVALEKATRNSEQATQGLMGSLAGVGKSILTTAAGFFTAQAAFNLASSAMRGLVDQIKAITVGGAGVADVAENFEHLTGSTGRLPR